MVAPSKLAKQQAKAAKKLAAAQAENESKFPPALISLSCSSKSCASQLDFEALCAVALMPTLYDVTLDYYFLGAATKLEFKRFELVQWFGMSFLVTLRGKKKDTMAVFDCRQSIQAGKSPKLWCEITFHTLPLIQFYCLVKNHTTGSVYAVVKCKQSQQTQGESSIQLYLLPSGTLMYSTPAIENCSNVTCSVNGDHVIITQQSIVYDAYKEENVVEYSKASIANFKTKTTLYETSSALWYNIAAANIDYPYASFIYNRNLMVIKLEPLNNHVTIIDDFTNITMAYTLDLLTVIATTNRLYFYNVQGTCVKQILNMNENLMFIPIADTRFCLCQYQTNIDNQIYNIFDKTTLSMVDDCVIKVIASFKPLEHSVIVRWSPKILFGDMASVLSSMSLSDTLIRFSQ